MSNKGNNRHLKRLATSKYAKVHRKTFAYMIKPAPGRHRLDSSISIATILKEKLNLALNSREAKQILKNGQVKINDKVVKEEKYPVGYADFIELKVSGDKFVVDVDRYGVFAIKKLEGKDTASRVFKVIGKFVGKNKVEMIRLHNGNIVKIDKNKIKVNDSVILKDSKIEKVLEFKEGAKCKVIKGAHAPTMGAIESISEGSQIRDRTVKINDGKEVFETLIDNIIVGA